MMKGIILAGGAGFLGHALAGHFLNSGHAVTVLTRSPKPSGNGLREIQWDASTLGDWTRELEGAMAVINLTGRSVNCRYHPRNRKLILESRVRSTQVIGEAIAQCKTPPPVWLNASTATIYQHTFGPAWDEAGRICGTAEAKDEFSVRVATDWERALNEAQTPATRKIAMRAAMVLGRDENSVFPMLCRLAQFGFGGKMGDGRQFVSWIHQTDFCRAVEWLIAHEKLHGPVNICAPQSATQYGNDESIPRRCGPAGGFARREVDVGSRSIRFTHGNGVDPQKPPGHSPSLGRIWFPVSFSAFAPGAGKFAGESQG